MRQILDRLLISELSEANDPYFLKRHKVQSILYFGTGGMFPEDIKLYYRPSLPDGSLSREQLKDGVDFLRESLRAGRRVLAVGPTGATLVGAYLAEMGFSCHDALSVLKAAQSVSPDEESLAEHARELEIRGSQSLYK